MKRGQYVAKTALCPFYKKEDQQKIYCCGIRPNASTHIAFGNGTDCLKYKQEYCRQHYSRCHVYKMLEEVSDV